jgi:SAM-dependent methyltransferase
MLDTAASAGMKRPVEWRQADAMQLPFGDRTFDAVICQFGAMFFPDRIQAYSEAHRVLRPGGTFLFNVWDRIEENEFADTITTALASLYPDDPPRFLARTPHGSFDRDTIGRHLAAAGFTAPMEFVTLAARSRAESAGIVANAYCQGTPLRNEIEGRGQNALGQATEAAALAIAHRFGNGSVEGKIQAHIVSVQR